MSIFRLNLHMLSKRIEELLFLFLEMVKIDCNMMSRVFGTAEMGIEFR